ncbi:MAG: peptidoglycan-binding domain-containing protein [Candidatus Roizmanbacteria bacterium]
MSNYNVYSAHPPYRSRVNFPSGGMYLQNLGEVLVKIGTTLEILDVSQKQHESEINRDITVATPTKVQGYVNVAYSNIDAVAGAIEASGHCILLFHANGNEWKSKPVYNGKEINFGHAVCSVDYALVDGEKVIIIEDSASRITSIDTLGQRLITEDYLKARCTGASYLIAKPPKLTLTLKRNLKIGCVGDDVKTLQYILKIGADSLFGTKTQKAVIEFQKAHNLTPDGIVGKNTCSILNQNY